MLAAATAEQDSPGEILVDLLVDLLVDHLIDDLVDKTDDEKVFPS